MTRREVLELSSLLAFGAARLPNAYGASARFWESRPASQWTPEETQEFLNRSPWAKEVTVQYRAAMDDIRIQPGREPVQGRGEQRAGECGLVPCSSVMPGRAIVLWESAQPVQEALHPVEPRVFNGHYVISVRGLVGGHTLPDLQEGSDLSAKGRPPVQPGVVQMRSNTYLFGFSKDLISFDASDRDVQFTVRTGPDLKMTLLRATFYPKEMIYREALAV